MNGSNANSHVLSRQQSPSRNRRGPQQERLQQALKQTTQTTRQLKLWWKHSLQLPGKNGDVFESTTTPSSARNRFSTTFASTEPSSASMNAAATTPRDLSGASMWHSTPTSTATPLSTLSMVPTPIHQRLIPSDEPTIANVDDALAALSSYRDQFPVVKESDSVNQLDWILDGHPEWQQSYQYTQELLQQLYPTQAENDQVLPSLSSQHLSKQDEERLLLRLASSLGQQEFQFASFDDPSMQIATEKEKNESSEAKDLHIIEEQKTWEIGVEGIPTEEDDGFGAFQNAPYSTKAPSPSWMKEREQTPDGTLIAGSAGPVKETPARIVMDRTPILSTAEDLSLSVLPGTKDETVTEPKTSIIKNQEPSDSIVLDQDEPPSTPQPQTYNISTPQKRKNFNNTGSNNCKAADRAELETPTTNNYSQSKKSSSENRELGSSPHLERTRLFDDTVDDHMPQESTRSSQPASMTLDDSSFSSRHGDIPSVVQLVSPTMSQYNGETGRESLWLPSDDCPIPERMESKENDLNPSNVAVQERSRTKGGSTMLQRPSRTSTKALPLERQHSITSQHSALTTSSDIASPEGRFFRRHRSSFLREDKEGRFDGGDLFVDDPSFDDSVQGSVSKHDTGTVFSTSSRQESLGSLRSVLPEAFVGKAFSSYDERTLREKEEKEIVQVLSSLEWDWIPYWQLKDFLEDECDESFIPLWLEQLTSQLSTLDATHRKVCKNLYRLIQPRARELERANQAALDLSMNMALCEMYLQRSQRSISLARFGEDFDSTRSSNRNGNTQQLRGSGVAGAQQLLGWWEAQACYSELDSLLEEVSNLHHTEQALLCRIDEYDVRMEDSVSECRNILKEIESWRARLLEPSIERLDCFADLRKRASHLRSNTFASRLHVWLEAVASRVCHANEISTGELCQSAVPDHYGRLIEALVLTCDASTDDETHDFAKTFCASVQAALLLEAQKSFGMALLNPSGLENEESLYDKELLALSTNAYLDPARMAIWTHNLVTIRFDFELEKNHLPSIYHRLCLLLTNVLHGQHSLLKWHEMEGKTADSTSIGAAIYNEMQTHRSSVWNNSIKVLEECLEEYRKHMSKKKLFPTTNQESGDAIWLQDLIGLEDVLALTDQFLSLRKEFLVGIDDGFINDGSMLRENLYDIQKKHLRAVHVEAMNSMGLTLYREDWSLVPLTIAEHKNSDIVHAIQVSIRDELLRKATSECVPNRQWARVNGFAKENFSGELLSRFMELGNPFADRSSDCSEKQRSDELMVEAIAIDERLTTLTESYLGTSSLSSPLLPACLIHVFLPWISRLLLIWDRLPPIAEDICEVFCNLSDLYLTTSFRLCCGSPRNEEVVLGMVDTEPTIDLQTLALKSKESSSNMFRFSRKPSAQAKAGAALSPVSHLNADICSPLESERQIMQAPQKLLNSAQESLKDIAKLDLVDGWIPDPEPAVGTSHMNLVQNSGRVLEKRQAACWGSLFLAQVLQIARAVVLVGFERKETGRRYGLSLKRLIEYVDAFIFSVPTLIQKGSEIACSRAIRAGDIVRNIHSLGDIWAEPKLHEQPNDYVDLVCESIILLWKSLYNSRKLPLGAIEMTWATLVESAFAAILEGFTQVLSCSTEGRALMSMDIAAFASGISRNSTEKRSPKPPPHDMSKGKHYVDTYVRIFYFPVEDAMSWIQENYVRYRKNHMIALIIGAALSSGESMKTIPVLVGAVDSMYSS